MTTTRPAPLLTVGHGKLRHPELAALLHGADVTHLVDVRSHPGSRHNPDVFREALADSMPGHDIAYRWEPRLGGRRRPVADAPDTVWQVASFRAYAVHTRTSEFTAAMDELLDQATMARTAIMCSESMWWRCHRRLIADVVSLTTDVEVFDLAHDGRLTPHPVAEGARVRDDGQVVWDGAAPASCGEESPSRTSRKGR